jgi:chromosome segregation ATPase
LSQSQTTLSVSSITETVEVESMSSEIEKIKKKLDALDADIKKHTAQAVHADKKRLDDLDARLKALEEKAKKKM